MMLLVGVSILFNLFFSAWGKAGEIVVYTALEDDQVPRYLESFKKNHPEIQLKIARDSTGIITAKLLAERSNPQADVIWGLAATSLLLFDQKGMLEPYSPRGIERINPRFRDSRNSAHWVGIDAWMTAFCVNTIEMQAKKLPMPDSYADLIKPVYRGQLVMPNPASSGTGFLTVSALIQLMGEKKAWDYMDKLHGNMAVYTHSGSKPCKMAGQGEYPIGISFGYRGITQKKKGEPVETVFPKEGSGWDLEANALVKKGTVKKEAKIFLDWAVSDSAMSEYSKSFAIVSAPTDQLIPEGFPKDPLRQLIKNDFAWAAANRDRILEEWNRRYGSKSEPKK
jgi:iron(III) transport system substrate-binding protein